MYHRRRQQIRAPARVSPPAPSPLPASSRRSLGNGIVHNVIPPAAIRAKLAVVGLVLITLLCGSVCSATCALGACPTDTQNASTHDCDHNASLPAHQRTPQNPDCPKHHHPTFDALKTDALSQSQSLSINHAIGKHLLAITTRNEAAGIESAALSEQFASPPNLDSPLQQQISVLRI